MFLCISFFSDTVNKHHIAHQCYWGLSFHFYLNTISGEIVESHYLTFGGRSGMASCKMVSRGKKTRRGLHSEVKAKIKEGATLDMVETSNEEEVAEEFPQASGKSSA